MARCVPGATAIRSSDVMNDMSALLSMRSEKIQERICGIVMTLACQMDQNGNPVMAASIGQLPDFINRIVGVVAGACGLQVMKTASSALYFLAKAADNRQMVKASIYWRTAVTRISQNSQHDPQFKTIYEYFRKKL